MIWVIARHELVRLFISPLAWLLLAMVQGLLAWLFIWLVEDFQALQQRLLSLDSPPGVSDLIAAPLLQASVWVLLLVVPILTMRIFSEERRSGVLDLLLSAPISMMQIVIGKYLGLLGFLTMLILLIALMPLALGFGANLDIGKLCSGLLGLVLLSAAALAAGLYFSTLTVQPSLAALATLGLLLGLWMIDGPGMDAENILAYLSLRRHYHSFLLGLFDSSDCAYYLLFSVGFLSLTMRRLDNLRLRD